MTLEELKVEITAQTSGFKKELKEVKDSLDGLEDKVTKQTNGIKNAFGKLLKGIIALKIGQTIGRSISNGFRDAMKVESSLQQIQRQMGESSNAFLKWSQIQAIGFGMSTSEALRYGAIYGNLLSTFSKDATETFNNTQALLKASAVVASSTGRTMEDTMERIRSGLLGNTEAIEDLGINVNIAMIESTNAFKQFANGQAWNQLSFQTQQQIRLTAILEQANQKYGDTIANNTSTKVAMLTAHLNNAKLALGQAFLPIANAVLPLLTAMAAALSRVINLIAQFTTALFGSATTGKSIATSTGSASTAVGDLGDSYDRAGKSAKKFNKTLMGFDEINTLNSSSDSGAGGSGGALAGGGGISIPSLDGGGFLESAVVVSEKVKAMADKVKSVLSGLKEYISQYKVEILSVVGGIVGVLATIFVATNWATIIAAIKTAILGLKGAFLAITAPISGVALLVGALVATVIYLWNTSESFRNATIALWGKIKEVIMGVIDVVVTEGKKLWDNYIKGFLTSLGAFLKSLMEFIALLWSAVIAPLLGFIVDVLKPVIVDAFRIISEVIGRNLGTIFSLLTGFMNILRGVMDFITGVFTGNWSKAWGGVKTIFKTIFDSLVGIVKSPLNFIVRAVNSVIRGINRFKIDIPSWAAKLADIAGFKGGYIGFNIPTIPMLAQGGYVGANNPMLAVIGDNKRQGEIVAPENKIYEQTLRAVTDGLRTTGGSDRSIDLTINLGSTTVFHEIINGINKAQRQAGKTLIKV